MGEKPHFEPERIGKARGGVNEAGSGQVEERGYRSFDQKESGKVEEKELIQFSLHLP